MFKLLIMEEFLKEFGLININYTASINFYFFNLKNLNFINTKLSVISAKTI